MARTNEELIYLYGRYTEGACTEPEMEVFLQYVNDPSCKGMLQELADSQLESIITNSPDCAIIDWEHMYQQIISDIPVGSRHAGIARRVHFLRSAWFRYAAILLLITGTAIYLYTSTSSFRKNPGLTKIQHPRNTQDIQPGGNRAILTLSDGSTILLDSAANGSLAQQGNSKVIKLNDGQVRYEAVSRGQLEEHALAYNTISTPNGGQYQIVLPDGSKVWLNAVSSIRFATVFEKDRRVSISGEAYLEIAKDVKRPFLVSTSGTEVQVLGTSFNVNNYENEKHEKITLLNGSIKVVSMQNKQSAILKPGEEAVAIRSGIQVNRANTEQTVAWKNGVFNLSDADIYTLMREMERWYNIKVEYQGDITKQLLQGSIERNLPLSKVLRGLERMGNIHFNMQGNKVTVLP